MDPFSISYYDFRFCISNRNKKSRYIYIYPEHDCFGYFHTIFNSLENLKNSLKSIKDVLENGESITIPGGQESYIVARKDYLEFVVTLPGYEEPFFVETQEFLRILEEYEVWLTKLENCEIPGIIPESKSETWSCVPNEYVKPEYMEQMNKRPIVDSGESEEEV